MQRQGMATMALPSTRCIYFPRQATTTRKSSAIYFVLFKDGGWVVSMYDLYWTLLNKLLGLTQRATKYFYVTLLTV